MHLPRPSVVVGKGSGYTRLILEPKMVTSSYIEDYVSVLRLGGDIYPARILTNFFLIFIKT